MKRLALFAACAAGFMLIAAPIYTNQNARSLTINGHPFGTAVLVNGVWAVPLEDVQKNVGGQFTVLGNRLQVARDPASGLPTGKRMHKPFVITKELDKSSPLLYQSGGKFYVGLADLAKLFGGTFSEAPKNERPSESISLNFTKIEFEYR
ncbi:MAG TPA: type VI secretion system tube protein Hcp [Thermoanaerobaculia bacterium]|nr:type VI secretion system tube protein Hcp [Thermoanaerobaculia bacterium]